VIDVLLLLSHLSAFARWLQLFYRACARELLCHVTIMLPSLYIVTDVLLLMPHLSATARWLRPLD
jgi:hypothetical protein